jgi:hypothetical protein
MGVMFQKIHILIVLKGFIWNLRTDAMTLLNAGLLVNQLILLVVFYQLILSVMK